MRSSTTANGGFLFQAGAQFPLRLMPGAVFRAILRMTDTIASGQSATIRLGFHSSVTSADAVNGVYLEIFSSPTLRELRFKTADNSVRTTATVATFIINTWYHVDIEITSLASVRCRVWTPALTLVMDRTITTNIPNSTRNLFAAVVATETSTTAVDICHLDYAGFGLERPSELTIPTFI
ncbi:MAG TPA: hypothetical protein VLH56_16900 [Dissulfurispiraceae bacterium]|nr:hypothetical protein [Dissulfurispiraceae bacterium]